MHNIISYKAPKIVLNWYRPIKFVLVQGKEHDALKNKLHRLAIRKSTVGDCYSQHDDTDDSALELNSQVDNNLAR